MCVFKLYIFLSTVKSVKKHLDGQNRLQIYSIRLVCKAGTVIKISDCQPEGPGFSPRPGQGLNFG